MSDQDTQRCHEVTGQSLDRAARDLLLARDPVDAQLAVAHLGQDLDGMRAAAVEPMPGPGRLRGKGKQARAGGHLVELAEVIEKHLRACGTCERRACTGILNAIA